VQARTVGVDTVPVPEPGCVTAKVSSHVSASVPDNTTVVLVPSKAETVAS
jgi:hypothetical protein